MLTPQRHFFELPVWRVMFDSILTSNTSELLAIELRNKSKVEWCVINTATSQVLWQHTFKEADWWTSLIGFYSGKILLHVYEGNDQPAPKRLLCIDTLSGQILWILEGNRFERTDGRIVQTSGTVFGEIPSFEYRRLSDGKILETQNMDIIAPSSVWKFPINYQETSPYYVVLSQFILKKTTNQPLKAINYGEIAGHILFFQYLYHHNATTLSQSILIVNTTKTVLWHETIDSDIDASVLGECLYNDDSIVYIKDLTQLVVLNLPKP